LHVKESEVDAMKDKVRRGAEDKDRHVEQLQGSSKEEEENNVDCLNSQDDQSRDDEQALMKDLDEIQNLFNAWMLRGMYANFS
jgi:hypothetical protein